MGALRFGRKLGRLGAFTLIELMIVVVIVAILAMVAVPLYRANVTHAKMSEGLAAVGSIRTAFRVYAAGHNDTYPDLSGADGTELWDDLNIPASDLNGKYFDAEDYEVNSNPSLYRITATEPLSGLIYEINQDGAEKTGDGYYTTGH